MRAAEWIATVAWCITAEALEAMVSIAARDPLPDAAARLHGPSALALRQGARRDDSARMVMRDGVAVISIDGPIYRYADFFTEVSGGVTTEALARDLAAALDDPQAQAVLFVVDSPGGEATGIGELADAIYAARDRKPVWAYVEGYGASAAYWIASAASRVVIDPSALLGSIGTVMSYPNPEARPKPARSLEVVSSQSPKKRIDPNSQAGRGYLQRLVDDMTEVFMAAVQRNRGLTRDQVLAAEGGLLVGQQAVDAGLADALGSEEGALSALREQAAANRRPAVLITTRRPGAQEESMKVFSREWWGALFSGAQDAQVSQAAPAGPAAEPAPPVPVMASLLAGEPLRVAAAEEENYRAELRKALDENERLRAAQQQASAQQAAQAAQAFAAEMVATRRALPAEQAALAALYAQAAADDAARPAATPRTDALRAAITARPPHQLTAELLDPAADLSSLSLDRKPPAAVAAERRQRLLASTPLGRQVLAKK